LVALRMVVQVALAQAWTLVWPKSAGLCAVLPRYRGLIDIGVLLKKLLPLSSWVWRPHRAHHRGAAAYPLHQRRSRKVAENGEHWAILFEPKPLRVNTRRQAEVLRAIINDG
jgi:hypothetical protein